MKKIILVAAILTLCFSGISNAALLYEDTSDYWFGPSFLGGISDKTWSWTNNVGPLTSAELTIRFFDVGLDCIWEEYAKVKIDGVSDGKFEVDTGDKNYDVIGFLDNGSISWKVSQVSGTFWVKNVALNGTAAVPEPATMLLLGLGLVGLAGLGRKKFN